MNESRLQRRALLVVGLLTMVFVVLAPGEQERSETVRPSTHLLGDGGARAFYEALERLGQPVARWMRPLEDLDHDPGDVLVLLHPSEELTEGEADLLLGWVGRGGHLLFAPEADEADPLSRRLGAAVRDGIGRLRMPARADAWALRVVGEAGPGFGDADEVLAVEELLADRIEPVLVDDEGGAALVRLQLGAGSVLLLSDVARITNGALRESALAPIVLRALLALDASGPVRFDEFHHGYQEGAGLLATTGRWLVGSHAGWSVIGLVVLTLLALVFAGVRFGPPIPEPAPPGRSSLEHVDALAAAYEGAGAAARPARLLVEGLRHRLGLHDAESLEQRLGDLAAARPDRAEDVAIVLAAHAGRATASATTTTTTTTTTASASASRRRGRELVALSDALDRVLGVFAGPDPDPDPDRRAAGRSARSPTAPDHPRPGVSP